MDNKEEIKIDKNEFKIVRYDPRKDKEELEALISDFEYRSVYPIDLEKFIKEIDNRVKDLKLRNAMILAKEKDGELGRILGAGFFTIWKDYLGNTHCIVHDVVVRKENSFKKGIEEAVYRELFTYLKKTMKISKIELFAKNDPNFQSLLMKLKIKKSKLDFYESDI